MERKMETTVRVWLDDERVPPEGWLWVKTATHAISLISSIVPGQFEEMSFDHDLGWCQDCESNKLCSETAGDRCLCLCHKDGYDVAKWMEENDLWPRLQPRVHSMNPVGRKNILAVIERKYGPGYP